MRQGAPFATLRVRAMRMSGCEGPCQRLLCRKMFGEKREAGNRWCQGRELNPRPRAYESPALPLSYPGNSGQTTGTIMSTNCFCASEFPSRPFRSSSCARHHAPVQFCPDPVLRVSGDAGFRKPAHHSRKIETPDSVLATTSAKSPDSQTPALTLENLPMRTEIMHLTVVRHVRSIDKN